MPEVLRHWQFGTPRGTRWNGFPLPGHRTMATVIAQERVNIAFADAAEALGIAQEEEDADEPA